ncbi:MAG: type I restriction endonuclease subunit R [Chloroflexi bacterium]|nr:type I restriction endonuclease subunit R [Chloroflexota bacterium]
MSANDYSEDALVEKPAIDLFKQLRWETANCYDETFPNSFLGRETSAAVVLVSRLRPALQKLNPGLSSDAINTAIEELTRDRSVMTPAAANREIYQLLKDGIKVNIRNDDDEQESAETVAVLDWNDHTHNDYFLASQFWVSGEMYKRRADLVGFVNGIPLVFIELKAAQKSIEDAYHDNLRDYKNTIPQLFWYNAIIILSNGSESRIGSITAEWGHFSEWKRINSEGEQGVVSLETILRGTCERTRLLDLVENFILFEETKGGMRKLIAKNHQYLGVNNSIAAVQSIGKNRGRLGVFWHTQGSGKSYSMVMFSQKILRKLGGNYSFVVLTDRDDLDGQIYKNFVRTAAVTEDPSEVRAESGEHLKKLLTENHRYVFTLIQKFHAPQGEKYSEVSARQNIIVMADEAHRSQYDTFALNMRNALPNAAFIAFTGTPLIAGEERTKKVFGDYVSIYNFKQSADDHATVPLYYENRIPELQLTNDQLNPEMYRVIDDAAVDAEQEKRLEREFTREYQLITRDERLEKIAEDIVQHFLVRAFKKVDQPEDYGLLAIADQIDSSKAMVVSVDKATAMKMYDKVKKYWNQRLVFLQADLLETRGEEKEKLLARIRFMQETDMSVVVSQSQNEIEDLREKGIEIESHRRRMVTQDLDEKFKDPADPFRIVFVCAMWMTGFDVPSCATIYLDKPMRNHTLMQTIARANRVFGDKINGLIVDYIGVFRNLQNALAIYGSASGGGIQSGDTPVQAKRELVEELRRAVVDVNAFCRKQKVNLPAITIAKDFQRIKLLGDAADALVTNDDTKRKFLLLASRVIQFYQAVLPDRAVSEFAAVYYLTRALADKVRSLEEKPDISSVAKTIEELLDQSIAPLKYEIRGEKTQGAAREKELLDLSKIDFETLKKQFDASQKRAEIEQLRGVINRKLTKMIRLNRTRMDYYEKFQQMIADYNAGATNTDAFFAQLVKFARELSDEEKRSIAEELTEEELTLFDLLTKPDLKLTPAEKKQVRKVAQELLETLKKSKLVLDWRKKQQARAAVRIAIREQLENLPKKYLSDLFQPKCDSLYQHVYDSYYGEEKSVYNA